MELIVAADGTARWGARAMRCAVGRSGVRADKREGDGATPLGAFPMRGVLYRADREAPPKTRLVVSKLSPSDGWCDDARHADYNKKVALPHAARCESLWRDDRAYDLIVVLGYNDAPVVKDKGSAIFLHLARDNFAPTEGCVALARDDLLFMLSDAAPGDVVRVLG
jgi:L,D-peptidoglycan transpeptidase YkuD (ErfK/YbiS/YcfS/YnhG family)